MAKTRKRDEKFKILTVRFPESRVEELETAAREIGLDSTNFMRMKTMELLNARRSSVTEAAQ